MTKSQEKQALRVYIRQLERELPPSYKLKSDRAIAAHLLSLPDYLEAGTVFCFVGTAREINTHPVLEDALSRGKRVCVPLCTSTPGMMELRVIRSMEDLTSGAYGILAPLPECPAVAADEVDFAVLPCLTCDHAGHRLGQGGGYYDRFLSAYRGSAVLVCRERLIREEIPLEPHDIPIPWVITETGLYEDGVPARPQ